MQASKPTVPGKHGTKSEALLSPLVMLAKTTQDPKGHRFKQSLKEDLLDKTKLFTKSKRQTPSMIEGTGGAQNSRGTLKDRGVASPSSAKQTPYGLKVNQHFSPVANSRSIWESKPGQMSYLQAMKSMAQATPKSMADCVRSRNMSTKNLAQKTLNCFMSTKNPKLATAELGADARTPANKHLVLTDKVSFANKAVEAPIKLKLPERTRDRLQAKNVQAKLVLGSPPNQNHSGVVLGKVVDAETRQDPPGASLQKVLAGSIPKNATLPDDHVPTSTKNAANLKSLKSVGGKAKDTLADNELALGSIDVEAVSDLDLELVLAVAGHLATLHNSITKSRDPSSILKQYTELVQDKRFGAFELAFLDAEKPKGARATDTSISPATGLGLGADVRLSLRLEILTVMHIFFALVENDTKARPGLAEALELCCSSSFCILSLLADALECHKQRQRAKLVREALKNHPGANVGSSLVRKIAKNNNGILSKLHFLGEEGVFTRVASGITALLPRLHQLPFERAVESIFECFFDVLKQKGAMSVLYNDDAMPLPTPDDEPNFVLQPFNNLTYLPAKVKPVPLTLVLDLDETLVHYAQVSSDSGEFYIRPFSQEFLVELSPFFEIVIFTAAVKCYADWIIDRLDTQGCVSYRLYRCSTKQQKGVFIKDLSRIGRDLSKTIIVDNNPDNFQYQAENGIFIKSWYDDPNDTALEELSRLLRFVARRASEDVRAVLAEIRVQMQSKTLQELVGEN